MAQEHLSNTGLRDSSILTWCNQDTQNSSIKQLKPYTKVFFERTLEQRDSKTCWVKLTLDKRKLLDFFLRIIVMYFSGYCKYAQYMLNISTCKIM